MLLSTCYKSTRDIFWHNLNILQTETEGQKVKLEMISFDSKFISIILSKVSSSSLFNISLWAWFWKEFKTPKSAWSVKKLGIKSLEIRLVTTRLTDLCFCRIKDFLRYKWLGFTWNQSVDQSNHLVSVDKLIHFFLNQCTWRYHR